MTLITYSQKCVGTSSMDTWHLSVLCSQCVIWYSHAKQRLFVVLWMEGWG